MQSPSTSFLTENNFTISSEAELFHAFRECDRKKLILPDTFKFPLKVRSYLAWREPSGVYTYLVFKLPNWDLPKGVAFKRTVAAGEIQGGLCSWCNAYGGSDEISFLSVIEDAKTSRSYFLCSDLSCIDKIEDATTLGGKDPYKYIKELYHRMDRLFHNIGGYHAE